MIFRFPSPRRTRPPCVRMTASGVRSTFQNGPDAAAFLSSATRSSPSSVASLSASKLSSSGLSSDSDRRRLMHPAPGPVGEWLPNAGSCSRSLPWRGHPPSRDKNLARSAPTAFHNAVPSHPSLSWSVGCTASSPNIASKQFLSNHRRASGDSDFQASQPGCRGENNHHQGHGHAIDAE